MNHSIKSNVHKESHNPLPLFPHAQIAPIEDFKEKGPILRTGFILQSITNGERAISLVT